jgi:hypothetical protein
MIEALKQWAFTLVLTAMAGSVAVAVSNSQNMKKYIRFACALVALAVMIAPISSLFHGLPDILNYNNNINRKENEVHRQELDVDLRRIIMEKSAEILEQRISATIHQKTGIKPENIYIYSNINNNTNHNATEADVQVKTEIEIEIEKVIINMPEEADINMANGENRGKFSEIQAYLKEILNCEIVIE